MRIVFFGDSITEGCFELFDNHCGGIDVVRDVPSGYASLVTERLKRRFGDSEITAFNAGVGGETAADGLNRIESDVVAKNPDIVTVCFGLNDIGQTPYDDYGNTLAEIFKRLNGAGAKVIFMTPNMVNTYVHPLNLEILKGTAESCAERQNNGTMDTLMDIARQRAAEYGVPVCDAYAVWKKMSGYGVDTTALLCNHINHPTREMHRLFADMLEKAITEIMQKDI